MAEKIEDVRNRVEAHGHRSAEEIREDIDAGKDAIAETVDRLGERIQETLDWREYLRRYPFWGLGASAGLGFLISGIFVKRVTPMEQIIEELRDIRTREQSQTVLKRTLFGLLAGLATNWIKNKTVHSRPSSHCH
jgi:ElaB/YqjD/DUF883 family membrane-anchored ribosome-binding protein